MNPGQLNHRITIHYTTGSMVGSVDGNNQFRQNYNANTQVWAAVDSKALRESVRSGVVFEAGTIVFITRFYGFITETAEIEYNNARYDIVAAYEVIPRQWLQVVANKKRK